MRKSIARTQNLRPDHFRWSYLIVDDIWIPLGESLLIEMFSPLWNRILDGFGIHDPGSGRHKQKASSWDILHPGRSWTNKLTTGKSTQAILEMLDAHFKAK